MKTRLGVALLTGVISCSAHASNWLQLQGNEAPNAPAFRVFGFVQPTYTYIAAEPLTTLQGAAAVHNGKYSALNLNWPNLQQPHEFQILRAGLGARGTLSDAINYFADLRYDYLDFMTQARANEREFATATLGIQYFINPAARDNAQAIADNLGDRASMQLTWSF